MKLKRKDRALPTVVDRDHAEVEDPFFVGGHRQQCVTLDQAVRLLRYRSAGALAHQCRQSRVSLTKARQDRGR